MVSRALPHAPAVATETYVDCTLGRGGHAEAVAARVGPTGRVIGFDLDPANLDHAAERLGAAHPDVPFTPVHANFVEAPRWLGEAGVAADLLLADLGFSSSQMDDASRGFSFRGEGPLDMRLNPRQSLTAAELVNRLGERELADLIFRYGEDPFARRIAKKLVENRKTRSIETTASLAQLVREAYGPRARSSRIDPATRTFMALRIAVNDELNALQALLGSIDREARRLAASTNDVENGWLRPGARIGIISFHSLEDRMVKRTFAALTGDDAAERLTRKPVTADEAETQANPRARSAKLRAIRLADGSSR